MHAMQPLQLKRLFLYLLILSVCLSALTGIVVLLAGDFGWMQVRILLTTVTLTAASICGLACGALWERGRLRALALGGIALAVLSGAALIAGMWIEVTFEAYWKTAASLTVFAIAAAHLSLLSLARLASRFRWAWVGAYVSIISLALLIVGMILGEAGNPEAMFRILGVLAIISTSFTIMIPILHRLSRESLALRGANGSVPDGLPAEDEVAIDAEIARLQERIAALEARKWM